METLAAIVAWLAKLFRPQRGPDQTAVGDRATNVGRDQTVTFNLTAPAEPPAPAPRLAGPAAPHDPERPWLDPGDAHRGHFVGVSLRLTDLIPRDGGNPIIAGKKFEDCTLYGPVIVAFRGPGTVSGATVQVAYDRAGRDDLESVLYPVTPDRLEHPVVGLVLITQCQFVGHCRFVDVGFMGSQETIDMLRSVLLGGGGDVPTF